MIPAVVLATQVTVGDIAMLVTIVVLLGITTFLALAETALTPTCRAARRRPWPRPRAIGASGCCGWCRGPSAS